MAYATQITISTGNKVSINYQTQEVSLSVTYQLEREDTDVLAVVKEKTAELAAAHTAAWQTLRDTKVAAAKSRQAETPPTPHLPETQQETQTRTSLQVEPQTAPVSDPVSAAEPKSLPENEAASLEAAALKAEGTTGEQKTGERKNSERKTGEVAPASQPPASIAPLPITPVPLTPTPSPSAPITPGQVGALALLLRQNGWSDEQCINYLREKFGCASIDNLSSEQARAWLLELQRTERNAADSRRYENAHRNGRP